mmetsp:Transcript_84368/g.263710  ORF Transcript_84368/g.263710 Transcript_84368/m.263710 type:complete len:318 (+) Transcript_84368:791-1744(+)
MNDFAPSRLRPQHSPYASGNLLRKLQDLVLDQQQLVLDQALPDALELRHVHAAVDGVGRLQRPRRQLARPFVLDEDREVQGRGAAELLRGRDAKRLCLRVDVCPEVDQRLHRAVLPCERRKVQEREAADPTTAELVEDLIFELLRVGRHRLAVITEGRLDDQAPERPRGRHGEEGLLPAVLAAPRLRKGPEDEVAVLVVCGPPFGVRQDLVGLLQLLEALRRVGVVAVLVRVQLQREPPVLVFDVLCGGVRGDAQDLVVRPPADGLRDALLLLGHAVGRGLASPAPSSVGGPRAAVPGRSPRGRPTPKRGGMRELAP